jgi:hypothetical protein
MDNFNIAKKAKQPELKRIKRCLVIPYYLVANKSKKGRQLADVIVVCPTIMILTKQRPQLPFFPLNKFELATNKFRGGRHVYSVEDVTYFPPHFFRPFFPFGPLSHATF